MKANGIISGKILKGTKTSSTKKGVIYGRNNSKVYKHPIENILDSSIGKFNIPYEANGLVHIDSSKIEYLKS